MPRHACIDMCSTTSSSDNISPRWRIQGFGFAFPIIGRSSVHLLSRERDIIVTWNTDMCRFAKECSPPSVPLTFRPITLTAVPPSPRPSPSPPAATRTPFPYSSILVHLYYIRLLGTTKIMELYGPSRGTRPGRLYDDRCTATVNGLSKGQPRSCQAPSGTMTPLRIAPIRR